MILYVYFGDVLNIESELIFILFCVFKKVMKKKNNNCYFLQHFQCGNYVVWSGVFTNTDYDLL